MNQLSKFLLLLMLVAQLACDSNRIYEKNIDFKSRTWDADSMANFNFNILNAEQSYDIYYNVRNSLSYPFQNLYITYYLRDSLGDLLQSELVNFQLFHAQTGEPQGKGIGDIYSHQFKLIEDYQFAQSGLYQLQIEQYMRMDSLPEVISIGVKVVPSEESEE